MKHLFFIYLIVLSVCLAACDQVKAQKGTNPKLYLTILEEGLTKQMCFFRLPQGRVTIMSGLSSSFESNDHKAMRFQLGTLKTLQAWEKAGWLSLSEKKQSSLDQIGSMGARFFTVTPTEKIRQLADAKESNEKWLAVPIRKVKVVEILSEEPCKLKAATPGDEFRLIVGLVSNTPTQQAKALGPGIIKAVGPEKLKFRAALQFNRFNKSYIFITSDHGKPDEAGWESQRVVEIIGR